MKKHTKANQNCYNKENIDIKHYKNVKSVEKKFGYSNAYNHKNKGLSTNHKASKYSSQSRIQPKLPKNNKTRDYQQSNYLYPKTNHNSEQKHRNNIQHINQRAKVLREFVKFPKIQKHQVSNTVKIPKKKSKSFKKILTQPCEQVKYDKHMTATLSPKNSFNMKRTLLQIVKNKQNRHLVSIDQQIQKLDILTKRYSCLRHDLALIQQDILTISMKDQKQDKNRILKQKNQGNLSVMN